MRGFPIRRDSGDSGIETRERIHRFDWKVGAQGNPRTAVDERSESVESFDTLGALLSEFRTNARSVRFMKLTRRSCAYHMSLILFRRVRISLTPHGNLIPTYA